MRLFIPTVLAILLVPSAAHADPITLGLATALAGAIGVSVATAKVIIAVVVTAVLAASQFFLTPKPRKGAGFSEFAQEAHAQTVEIRQPVVSRKYVVGTNRIAGMWVFADISEASSGQDLWIVFYLCEGPVEAIPVVLLDDYPVYPSDLDANGWITTGRYGLQQASAMPDGTPTPHYRIQIIKHLGDADQTADSQLQLASDKWTADHRLRGAAYLVVRMHYDKDLFQGGRPQVTAIVKGLKFVDPRDTASPQVAAWSPNAAVNIRGYLATAKKAGGYGCAETEINDASVIAAANICDEIVDTDEESHAVEAVNTSDNSLDLDGDVLKFQTGDRVYVATDGTLPSGLSGDPTRYWVIVDHPWRREDDEVTSRYPRIKLASSLENAYSGTAVSISDEGSGTITVTRDGEPRYTVDGVLDTGKAPGAMLREMLTAMAGRAVWTGGEFVLHAGAWQAANLTFSEGDFRGPVTVTTKHSRKERYNALKGNYSGPDHLYQPQPYPAVTNATFESEDNGDRILFDYDLPFTARATATQRIAKVELFRHRRQTRASIPMKLRGFQAAAGGTVAIDYDNRGWSGRTFEVTGISLETVDGADGPALGTQIELAELDSAVFDWDHSADEQPVNRPSPSTLGSPVDVIAPTIGTLASGTLHLYRKADGTVVSRLFVPWTASTDPFLDGYEIAIKKTADGDYPPAVRLSADEEDYYAWDVEDGVAYDARVRAVNEIGRRSDWSEATNHTIVGKTAPPSDVANVAAAVQKRTVLLTWDAIADADLKHYEVRSGASWAAGSVVDRPKTNRLEIEITAAGSTTYWVKAIDTTGNYSDTADSDTVSVAAPAAPTGLTLDSGGDKLFVQADTGDVVAAIEVSWSAPAGNLSAFEVQWRKSSGGSWDEDNLIVEAGKTKVRVRPVDSGVAYDVRVRAIDVNELAGAWVQELAHTVVGKTAAPADVASIGAQDTGQGVTVTIARVGDKDLRGYLYRYMDAAETFVWDDAIELNDIALGTVEAILNMPPGTWRIGVKAIDTTGNESANAATAILTVEQNNPIIEQTQHFPRWTGTKSNLIFHGPTGYLVPTANDADASDLWDSFDGPSPNTRDGYYEAPEVDFGADADDIRIHANITKTPLPEQAALVQGLIEHWVDYRTDGDAYDGFELWTVGVVEARFVKGQAHLKKGPADGWGALTGYRLTTDSQDRVQSGVAVVSIGGTAIVYPKAYVNPPTFIAVASRPSGDQRFAVYDPDTDVTATQATVRVHDDGNNDVGGEVSWQAQTQSAA